MRVGGQLQVQPPYSRGKDPCTHFIGGWVGPRADPDAVAKRKIPFPRMESVHIPIL